MDLSVRFLVFGWDRSDISARVETTLAGLIGRGSLVDVANPPLPLVYSIVGSQTNVQAKKPCMAAGETEPVAYQICKDMSYRDRTFVKLTLKRTSWKRLTVSYLASACQPKSRFLIHAFRSLQ